MIHRRNECLFRWTAGETTAIQNTAPRGSPHPVRALAGRIPPPDGTSPFRSDSSTFLHLRPNKPQTCVICG